MNRTLGPGEQLLAPGLPWAFSDADELAVACPTIADAEKLAAHSKVIAATLNEVLRESIRVEKLRFDFASPMEILMINVLSGCMYNLQEISDELTSLKDLLQK